MTDALAGDVGYTRPDFSIFTAGMEIDGTSSVERPVVRMIGSSTEQDLHRDTMTATALHDMTTRAPMGLLIWLNHDYTLPGSLFGSLNDTPLMVNKGGIADLHISVEVELENPEAAQTYKYIQRGRRLGCSIGCQVEDYEIVDTGDKSGASLLHITHVRPVEWSVVGIPANQRSWVENAANGLFERALRTGREDEAVKLAPIVKSLFPRNYKNLVKSIDGNTALRNELTSIPARPTPGAKLLWEPDTQKFYFVGGENGQIKREVERAQVSSFMDTIAKTLLASTPAPESLASAESSVTPEQYPVIVRNADNTITGLTQESIEIKAAEKSDHDEKVAAQKARAAACGIAPKDGGHLTCPSEWSSIASEMEAWGDYTNYAYPMADKEHADNAASRWGDESNRSKYSSAEQAIIGKRIAARQRHFGEKSDKSVNIIEILKLENGSTLYTFSDGSQRLETETTVDGVLTLSAVDIASDGSHDAMSGSHTHKHPLATDGEMHNHNHSHDNDSKHIGHDHSHLKDGEKSGEAEVVKSAEEAEVIEAKSAEVTAEVVTNDELKTETSEVEAPAAPVLDEQKQATLTLYNSIGASLGIAPVTDLSKAHSGSPESDAQVKALATQIDDAADKLLKVLGVPDVDIDDKSAETAELLVKSGAEISARNKARLKGAHDVLAAMAGGLHCAAFMAANNPNAQNDGDDDDQKSAEVELATLVEQAVEKAFAGLTEQIATVAKALESLGSISGEVDRVKKEFALARKSLEDTRVTALSFKAQVEDVASKGLGRPTKQFSGRELPAGETPVGIKSVDATEAPVVVAAKSVEEALEMTRKEYVQGIGIVRVWPTSALKEFRPALTGEEMSMMSTGEIMRYMDGGEARVPVLMS